LNPRPRAYESPALPLSYSGEGILVQTLVYFGFHLMFAACYSLFYFNDVQRQENDTKARP
jgi:hypothetical protein